MFTDWGLFSYSQSPYSTRNILSFTTEHTNQLLTLQTMSLEQNTTRAQTQRKRCPRGDQCHILPTAA